MRLQQGFAVKRRLVISKKYAGGAQGVVGRLATLVQ
jgi:hypothetical protein